MRRACASSLLKTVEALRARNSLDALRALICATRAGGQQRLKDVVSNIPHPLFLGGGLLAQHFLEVRLKLANSLNTRVFCFPRSHFPKGGERNSRPVGENPKLSGFKSPEVALKLCGAGD